MRPVPRRRFFSALRDIRTLGICAHIDAGKTTMTEALLFHAGAISRRGGVDAGTTVTDFLPQERERGITIQAAAVTFGWRGAQLNLIDTPGHVDFTVEVERSFRALDGAVLLLDGVAGVQAQTETVFAQTSRYGVARLGFVNKMDREGASFEGAAAAAAARLGAAPLRLHLPLGEGAAFAGVVDLLSMEAVGSEAGPPSAPARPWRLALPAAGTRPPPPGALLTLPARADGGGPLALPLAGVVEAARAAREALLEALADVDDGVAEAYLGAAPGAAAADAALPGLTRGALAAAIRRAVCGPPRARPLLPLLCGSAYKDRGVPALLDAIVDFLPSPAEKPPLMAAPYAPAAAGGGGGAAAGKRRASGARAAAAAAAASSAAAPSPPPPPAAVAVPATPTGPLRALAFKVSPHASRGALVYFRVYAGVLTRALPLLNTSSGAVERPTKLLQIFGDELREVEAVGAGCIGAASGLKGARTGDTLCHVGDPAPVVLPRLRLPTPVFSAALEVGGPREAKELAAALDVLTREDPSLRAEAAADTGQLLLSGMGELHLDVAADRLRREHGISGLTLGRVRVAYREAPTAAGGGAATFDRPLAGRPARATVALRVEPCEALRAAGRSEVEEPPEGGGAECMFEGAGGGVPPAPARRPLPPALAEALWEALALAFGRGPLLGAPLVGARVSVDVEGTLIGPDSTPGAVRAAASRALADALRDAGVALMEPVMRVEVSVAEGGGAVGEVISDLATTRRGAILEVRGAGEAGAGEAGEGAAGAAAAGGDGLRGRAVVTARVPLTTMVGYATALRSRTAGAGTFSMEFHEFEFMSAAAQAALLERPELA
jgi:elongation factor G